MPMHTGGGGGVAAGPAQVLGSVRSVAERETGLGKVEKVAAAFPVEGYSTDGDCSLITSMDAQLAWMRRMNRIFDSSGSGRARRPPLRMLVSRCGVSVGDLLGLGRWFLRWARGRVFASLSAYGRGHATISTAVRCAGVIRSTESGLSPAQDERIVNLSTRVRRVPVTQCGTAGEQVCQYRPLATWIGCDFETDGFGRRRENLPLLVSDVNSCLPRHI